VVRYSGNCGFFAKTQSSDEKNINRFAAEMIIVKIASVTDFPK
jgi:hypothetical protein